MPVTNNLARFDDDTALRLVAHGMTLPTLSTLLGNSFLKQTKNKANFKGLERFAKIGRNGRTSSKLYLDEDLIEQKIRNFSIESVIKFNEKLAAEVQRMRAFGYVFKRIDIDPINNLAKAEVLTTYNDAEYKFDLIFVDEQVVNEQVNYKNIFGTTKNIVVFASDVEEEFAILYTANSDNAIFNTPQEELNVTLISNIEKKKLTLYQNNAGLLYLNSGYYKHDSFFKYVFNPIQLQDEDSQILHSTIEYQVDKNGYFLYDGKFTKHNPEEISEDKFNGFARAFADEKVNDYPDYLLTLNYLQNGSYYSEGSDTIDTLLSMFVKDELVTELVNFGNKYFYSKEDDEEDLVEQPTQKAVSSSVADTQSQESASATVESAQVEPTTSTKSDLDDQFKSFNSAVAESGATESSQTASSSSSVVESEPAAESTHEATSQSFVEPTAKSVEPTREATSQSAAESSAQDVVPNSIADPFAIHSESTIEQAQPSSQVPFAGFDEPDQVAESSVQPTTSTATSSSEQESVIKSSSDNDAPDFAAIFASEDKKPSSAATTSEQEEAIKIESAGSSVASSSSSSDSPRRPSVGVLNIR